ncbi:heterokaryon incompatibility protein-domain-containing protein [Xylariaceae sp. FL1272]|nr:heterokaryon incompatibility protein-domain-containing protein [Xylariaceae sp. FL1272]
MVEHNITVMRLLHTKKLTLDTANSNNGQTTPPPTYAVLSHCWLGNSEISFNDLGRHVDDLRSGIRSSSSLPQVEKIRNACAVTQNKGIDWLWMDTCCIDKSNTKELQEAINSMFTWYKNAQVCIACLHDISKSSQQGTSSDDPAEKRNIFLTDSWEPARWITRGWTLQELLAPRELEFYDADWQLMGTKRQLAKDLSIATKINQLYITGDRPFQQASLDTKMMWMSSRGTTVPEDMFYSMLGILDINTPLKYGGGMPRAYRHIVRRFLVYTYLMDELLDAWIEFSEKDGDDPAKDGSADITDSKVDEQGLPAWLRSY